MVPFFLNYDLCCFHRFKAQDFRRFQPEFEEKIKYLQWMCVNIKLLTKDLDCHTHAHPYREILFISTNLFNRREVHPVVISKHCYQKTRGGVKNEGGREQTG